MNPLHELQSLLKGRPSVTDTGVVVSVTGDSVIVKTRGGLRTVKSVGATTYRAGDAVRLQDSVLLGKTAQTDSLPVFRV
jgi:hypothetical protein